jgi:predicted O-methyltransferase YrrM
MNSHNLTRSTIRQRLANAVGYARSRLSAVRIRRRYPQLAHALGVHSHLTPDERAQLFKLAEDRSSICEIGSYIGASACCFGAAMSARNANGVIICIDTWNNDAMTEGLRDTYLEFRTNTDPYVKHITPVRGFSTQVLERVRELTNHIDLLFIDGDHSYEGCKNDWEAYKGFLRPGSIVVFHDWGWADGVRRVVEEDARPHASTFGNLPNMWWATIKHIQ